MSVKWSVCDPDLLFSATAWTEERGRGPSHLQSVKRRLCAQVVSAASSITAFHGHINPRGLSGWGGGHMSHFKHYHQPLDAVYHYTHVLLMHDNTAGQLRKYTAVRLTRAWKKKKVSFCRQNKQGAHSVQIIGVCVDAEVPKDNQGFVSHKKCRLAPSLKANDHIRVASGCWSVKPLNVLLCQENVPAPSIQPHEKETGGEPLPQAKTNKQKKKNEWMDLWTQVCHIAVRDVLSWVFCLVKFMFYLER